MAHQDRQAELAAAFFRYEDGSSTRRQALDPRLAYLLTVTAYVALGQLARIWTTDVQDPQPFYPAAGVGVAVAYLVARRHRLLVVSLGVATGVLINHLLLSPGSDARSLVVDVLANTAESVLMVVLVQRFVLSRLPMRMRTVLLLATITALSCAVGATIATIGFASDDRATLWVHWLLGDTLGMSAVQTLPHLTWLRWVGDMPRRRILVEAVVASGVIVAGAALLFLVTEPVSFLVLPGVAWLSIRFGPRASMPVAFALVVVASIQTANGFGPFAHDERAMVLLQTYNASVLITAQLLGVHADRADNERRRLRGLLVALPDVVTLSDANGRVLHGFTPIGERDRPLRDLTEILPESERKRAHEARERVLAEGQSTDFWVFDAYTGERHFESRSARIADDQILTVTRDITHAVLNERDLRNGERMWRTLAETASEGILVVDANVDAVATFANARLAEILGWPADHIVGKRLSELAAEEFERIAPYLELLSGGEPISFEIEVDAGLPEHRWVLTSASPVMSDGEYTGAIGLFSDTTALHAAEAERRAIEERLRSVESNERRRLAQELHDGPIQELVAADLRLGALRRSVSDEHQPPLRGIEEIIENAVVQLRAMMGDLLPPEYQPGSVVDFLEEHIDRVVPAEMEVLIDDRLHGALSGPRANVLYLIGREAITNAVRHASAKRIEIVLCEDGGGVRLRVTDDGCGMDVERAPTKRGHLGLRSMHDRAEVVGGHVVISSTSGEGTTVDAWIPPGEAGGTNLYDLPAAPV